MISKQFFLIFIFVLSYLFASAQHLDSDKILKLEPHPNENGKFVAKLYSKYTRKLVEYWEMTGNAVEINVNNFNHLRGKHKIVPDGKHYKFYPNSTKHMLELNYKMGVKKGLFTGYYKTGEVRFKGRLGDPQSEKLTHYYKNGQVKRVEKFRSGIKWGKQLEYYQNGNQKAEIDYQNGSRGDRKYTFFYKNGQIKRKAKYKTGEKILEKCYDGDGNEADCSPITIAPNYPGGIDSLKALIQKIDFDFNADENDTLACTIMLAVDSFGVAEIYDFSFRNNNALYKELTKWVYKLPRFTPAQNENQTTNCLINLVFPVFQKQILWIGDVSYSHLTNRYYEKQEEIETYYWDFPIRTTGVIFFIVEEMPKFPGGDHALRKYIANTVKYPVVAQKNGIQGRVYVTFVIGPDGSVFNARIAQGLDPVLDNEAIRVINSLPKWHPAKQRGKPVSVSYTVPIDFTLRSKSYRL